MKKYLRTAGMLLVGLGIGSMFALVVLYDNDSDLSFTGFMLKFGWMMLCLFLSVYFHVMAHEAGHLVAARCRGWKFLSFMMLGVVLSRRDGRFRLSRFSIPGAAGQCLMLPPEKGDTAAGLMLYNAGGVLANLLVVLVSGFLLMAFHGSMPFLLKGFLATAVLVGLFLALLNGLPCTVNGIPNDGENIRKLRNDSFAAEAFLRTMRLNGFLMQDDERQLLSMPYLCDNRDVDFANPLHMAALAADVSLAMARMDFGKARAILQRIAPHKDRIAEIYRKELAMEEIYLTLLHPHDKADVDRLLTPPVRQHIRQQSLFRPAALRVEYALAMLHRQSPGEAEKAYHKFLKACRNYYIPGDAKIEERLVEHVRDKAEHEHAPA